jgi:hypothetical protein
MGHLRCPKCKQNESLLLIRKDKHLATKHATEFYKCSRCGFIGVPTEIKCQRCKNEDYELLLAKDGILYCIICWFHPLCSVDRLQEAIRSSRSALVRIK